MNQPLHIGLLTPAFTGVTGPDSGIGAHFRHLADGLEAAGHTAKVVVTTNRGVAPDAAGGRDVCVVCAGRRAVFTRLAGRFGWQLHQWLNLRASISAAARAAMNVDVEIWETTSTGSLALRFLARQRRAPVAVRVSTTAAQLRTTNAGRPHWISRKIEAWERATVSRADRVITHSALHRAAIASEFDLRADDIQIIPHGIPVPPVTPRKPARDRCSVLFVGRFEQRKGIDLLIGALSEFLAAVPGADVTLVGADSNGYWQNHWQQHAPASVRNRVRFPGVVDAAALASFYADADLFVAPSRYESFGLIFIEAMAHALPVVALCAPGASELIDPDVTGVLVPPDSPSALAAALIQLAHSPERRVRLGEAGRRVVEERYSIRALTNASVAFYRETIAQWRSENP